MIGDDDDDDDDDDNDLMIVVVMMTRRHNDDEEEEEEYCGFACLSMPGRIDMTAWLPLVSYPNPPGVLPVNTLAFSCSSCFKVTSQVDQSHDRMAEKHNLSMSTKLEALAAGVLTTEEGEES
ncbi:hypothetical protein PoB_005008800 [Plakobranchus ocellatus]|uniref:Uncharacterized protein n=1 Tax=Plakobranchus ocellatus TaxID=259542 RepID=A0AAV4BWJ7_9GAST|nr:hypothetical protein PoB_005008800 [Plakobranchus ocellatus]